MKLRMFTSLLLIMFLSVGSASVASAHEGCCKESHACCGHGWGWGHGWCHSRCNNYIYGPDGMYARCRDAHGANCCKKDADKDHKCADKCNHHNDCCDAVFHRAYYYEDCCGWGGHLSCQPHECDKDKDNDHDKD